MKKISLALATALWFGGAFGAPSIAVAADSCFVIGEKYAEQNGAALVAAQAATIDGRAVCEIVVLKQATNGNRPKREEVILPQ